MKDLMPIVVIFVVALFMTIIYNNTYVKAFFGVLGALAAVITIYKFIQDSQQSSYVVFKDTNLESAIGEAINLKDQKIPISETSKHTKLKLAGKEIKDLTGLEQFTNLIELHLENNYISDLEPIKELKQLKLLDLENNNISDISCLKKLDQLTVLDIRSNYVSDISVLKNMTQMKNLLIKNNRIYDISVLGNLHHIKQLSMGKNMITDISVLTKMPELENLTIGGNDNIYNIDIVMTIEKLSYLEIHKGQITDSQKRELEDRGVWVNYK